MSSVSSTPDLNLDPERRKDDLDSGPNIRAKAA